MNADAYCEICRKEFCNRYFLKVHKATKHGIFMSDEPLPLTPTGALGFPPNDLPPGTLTITPTEGEMASRREEREREASNGSEQVQDCHLCQKQFVNRANLKMHLANAHGLTPPPDFDAPPHSEAGMNKARSDKGAQGSMFGNMMAAKLADRVMCDICNKEVCNKYFLKTHKIKVHGVDPAKAEAETYSSPQKKQAIAAKLAAAAAAKALESKTQDMKPVDMKFTDVKPPTSLSSIPPATPKFGEAVKAIEGARSNGERPDSRPKDEELLRFGIDPEAYCELCKKEFCSKYFLKTHKQNIHGLQMDIFPNTSSSSSPLTPKHDSMTSASEHLTSLGFGRPDFTAAAMAALSRSDPMFPLNLMNSAKYSVAATSGNTSPSSSHADSDVTAGASLPKWRETEQKQTCELCNKELCNKYFLREHLLKKHGFNWDMVGPQSSATPALPFAMPGALPPILGLERGGPMDMYLPNFLHRNNDDLHQPLDLKKSGSCRDLRVGGSRSRDEKASGHDDVDNDVTAVRKISTESLALSVRRKYLRNRMLRHQMRRWQMMNKNLRLRSKQRRVGHHAPSREGKENAHPLLEDASVLPNGSHDYVMQSFVIEGQGQFASAKVKLPVYQTIDTPISVTFTLKPSP